ncbi:MAG TPA: fasciclin domain-containing protein [Polyangiaceae bacterium]|nr:fasciclin domain-containing protein [Polyangiaceae bacterium]
MKYLPWMSMMLVLSQSVLGCSDDTNEPTASGGSTSSGGKGSVAGSGGKSAAQGGSASQSGSAGAGDADAGAGGAQASAKDIVDTAVAAGSFTQLADALAAAGLVEALKGEGPFTVFAPTDEAFDAFEEENPGVLAGLSKDELGAVLKYHVVAGAAVESDALKDDQVFVTLNGSPVLIDTTGGVKVSDAKVTTADVTASNGVIHVIDKIILPPADDIVQTAIAAGTFETLAGALTAADLVATLQGDGPFTVFAPTDAAFDKLAAVPTGDALKDVLLYHVVSGAVGSGDLSAGEVSTLLEDKSLTVSLTGGVKINDAKVTTANIIAKNGVIHVVDTVLVPE